MNEQALRNNLIEQRKLKGITQKQLADEINYSDKVISKWERGESYPNIEALADLANYYNVTIDSLLGRNDNREDNVVSKTLKKLQTIKTKSPSIWRYLFITPFAAYAIFTWFFTNVNPGIPGMVLGFAIVAYSFLIAECNFETEHNDLTIRVENTTFVLKIFVNDELALSSKSFLKVNPVFRFEYNEAKIRVEMKNMTSIKCNVYITE